MREWEKYWGPNARSWKRPSVSQRIGHRLKNGIYGALAFGVFGIIGTGVAVVFYGPIHHVDNSVFILGMTIGFVAGLFHKESK